MRGGVFDGAARLVGKLAEVDFEGVGGRAEHVNVRAGAEDARTHARDDDGAHRRLLEAQPLDGVSQLDVHAEIIRVQLELVAVKQRRVFLHVHRQRGDAAVNLQLPVLVLRRRGRKIYHCRNCFAVPDNLAVNCGSFERPFEWNNNDSRVAGQAMHGR